MNGATPSWLDRAERLFGRPISLVSNLVALVGAFAAAWLLMANWVGVDSSLLLRTLTRDILPFAALYVIAALLTLREALHWYRTTSGRRRRIVSGLFLAAVLILWYVAYHDLRARTRHSLVGKEAVQMRLYGCNGNYQGSLGSIAHLANSSRFSFLRSDLEALANRERLLVHLKAGLQPQADGIALEERHMLFGIANPGGRPGGIDEALWRRWLSAIRDECRR